MTADNPDDPWAGDEPWTVTHPDYPLVDDNTAVLADEATVELTLLRAPMELGDGLADLHAMVSLLAQLRTWLPVAVATARKQGHSWDDIAAQLEVSPTTAKRRHGAYSQRRSQPQSPGDTPTVTQQP